MALVVSLHDISTYKPYFPLESQANSRFLGNHCIGIGDHSREKRSNGGSHTFYG